MEEVVASTYQIIKHLGQGGGGNVYLANHLRLNKKVVLKVDKRKITTRVEQLRREVDVLKTLNHPHIPRVYDFFVENGKVYTVMDFIEGESLDKAIHRGEKFSQAQVVVWAIQLLDALVYLHSPIHGDPPRGFIHSDIKPANLMRMPNNEICLIDFNIALALGETNIVGQSPGYASPEHYGLDYSSFSIGPKDSKEEYTGETLVTQSAGKVDDPAFLDESTGSSQRSVTQYKMVFPDVRSDIYSVGATLYCLLTGVRPAPNALDVVPLSQEKYSPLIVKIITRAMNPNPDLRYQSAAEMLDAFSHLRERDPRTASLRRVKKIGCIAYSVLAVAGIFLFTTGIKRSEITQRWLKNAEYSDRALKDGNSESAISFALKALPGADGILQPGVLPQAQLALTNALGVYDLSDNYKTDKLLEAPSAPLFLRLSPEGKTAACICSDQLIIFSTETAEKLAVLPTEKSALSEAEYLTEDTLVYAGEGGLTAYSIPDQKALWHGKPATGISISEDGTTVAAVFKDEPKAAIYSVSDGTELGEIDFGGRKQSVTVNDVFANPNDNLLELNADGSCLAVSFEDGGLMLYDTTLQNDPQSVLGAGSGFSHFEGGFHKQYFAFSASNTSDSVFAVLDTNTMEQTGGYQSTTPFSTQADDSGIVVQQDNLLVKIDPVTGENTALVTTTDPIRAYARNGKHTMISTEGAVTFFDNRAQPLNTFEMQECAVFLQISETCALAASRNSPEIRVMRYEEPGKNQVFSYDPEYSHDELRISADQTRVMLFSYKGFRIYSMDGTLIRDVEIPDAEQVYDQQFIRQGSDSYLQVIYNSGVRREYDASDGSMLREYQGDPVDPSMQEEFYAGNLKIESPLHGSPTAYNAKTGKYVATLSDEDYLTYVTWLDPYLIVQFVTAEGDRYGKLMDKNGNVLAILPDLCDVMDGNLIFDYPTGDVRESRIFYIDELIAMAKKQI